MEAEKIARTGGHKRSSGKSSLMPKSRSSKLFVSCLGDSVQSDKVNLQKALLYCVGVAEIQLPI